MSFDQNHFEEDLEEDPLEKFFFKKSSKPPEESQTDKNIIFAFTKGDLVTARNLLKENGGIIPEYALYWSVLSGQFNSVKYLVKKGVDIHKIYDFNQNLLDIANISQNNLEIDIFKYLIEKGVKNLRPNSLFYNYEFNKILIENGQPVTWELLMDILLVRDLDTVKLLLKHIPSDFDINQYKDIGGSILINAVNNCDINVIKSFVEHGADVNAHNVFESVVQKGNVDVIKYFIEKGVDINSNDGLVLKWAVYNNNFELLNILLERNVDINSHKDQLLENLVIGEQLEMLKFIIQLSSVQNSVNYQRLQKIAIEENNLEIADYLNNC